MTTDSKLARWHLTRAFPLENTRLKRLSTFRSPLIASKEPRDLGIAKQTRSPPSQPFQGSKGVPTAHRRSQFLAPVSELCIRQRTMRLNAPRPLRTHRCGLPIAKKGPKLARRSTNTQPPRLVLLEVRAMMCVTTGLHLLAAKRAFVKRVTESLTPEAVDICVRTKTSHDACLRGRRQRRRADG